MNNIAALLVSLICTASFAEGAVTKPEAFAAFLSRPIGGKPIAATIENVESYTFDIVAQCADEDIELAKAKCESKVRLAALQIEFNGRNVFRRQSLAISKHPTFSAACNTKIEGQQCIVTLKAEHRGVY